MQTVVITGALIYRQRQYLCWDSFKAKWFWGPRRLSEKFFPRSTSATQILEQLPGAAFRWEIERSVG